MMVGLRWCNRKLQKATGFEAKGKERRRPYILSYLAWETASLGCRARKCLGWVRGRGEWDGMKSDVARRSVA